MQAGSTCRLEVTGMDCGGCAKTLEASLVSISGVQSAKVNVANGMAAVIYDPVSVDQEDLVGRVRALGYGVREAPMPPENDGRWIFDVSGMDCSECAKTIEAGVQRLPGVATANVNFGAATLTVERQGPEFGQDAVVAAVKQAGYRATPRDGSTGITPPTVHRWWRQRRLIETIVAALLWAVGFGLERAGTERVISAWPYLCAMAVAGYPITRSAWYALKAHRADMNVLMSIAAVGAVVIGRWDEGASVLILFAIGLTLQTLTVERTRRAIHALVRLAPAEATVKRAGGEVRVPVPDVAVGEVVIVRPGDRVPVDGEVLIGRSALDQATITGESIPVEVEPASVVFAGSINGDGLLEVRSTKPASDTTLARIITMVEEAQASKAPAQAFVDRFAAVYTPIVVAAALLIATVVPLVLGDFRGWLFKALVLLVVACPCALVISTPVALVAAIGSASRRGVLFKGGAAIEALASVGAVAFDKTGTLTAGRPAVTDVVPLGTWSADAILAQAAAVEHRSTHPIARAIVGAAEMRGLSVPQVTDAQTVPGRGARGVVDGENIIVGSRRLFSDITSQIEQALVKAEQGGKTAVLVGRPDRIDGLIAVADPLRARSRSAVAALGGLGLRTVMLTGDNRHAAERIGEEVGVPDIRAELLPEDKVVAVRDLQETMAVAMIGDGVNDAPALAAAAAGVAMGAAGTDMAVEAADVTLMGDELYELPVAIRLARRTLTIIRQNIAASLLVKAVFLVLTFVGITNLWLAVLADTGMALLVTFNSLRLLRAADPAAAIVEGPSESALEPQPDGGD